MGEILTDIRHLPTNLIATAFHNQPHPLKLSIKTGQYSNRKKYELIFDVSMGDINKCSIYNIFTS